MWNDCFGLTYPAERLGHGRLGNAGSTSYFTYPEIASENSSPHLAIDISSLSPFRNTN